MEARRGWGAVIPADTRMLAGGAALAAAGLVLAAVIGSMAPSGQPGMTADEAAELRLAELENADHLRLSGLLVAVGFLLALVSFGARRRAKKP